MTCSELPGFYRLPMDDRRARVAEITGLSDGELDTFSSGAGLNDEQANRMVENALGVIALPLGLCVNLQIDGRDCLVPMATEEPSVVAAASFASKLLRAGGGIVSEVSPAHMIGQIQVLDVPENQAAETALLAARAELLELANRDHPSLIGAGGGAIDIEVHHLAPLAEDDPVGAMLVVHLIVDVQDAMGANAINGMCEQLAPRVAELTGGRVGLRILSNLADRRTVTVRGRVPFAMLRGRGCGDPAKLAQGIVEASVFAERDPYRAATHTKGIMNGVDAVLLAFGQDWRAVEAGAHAYAARDGRYTALARWRVEGEELVGELTLPMAVGTVGGVARVHPTVKISRRVASIDVAAELASITAAVGLAQNLSALRALAAEGIQSGHMRLHARNVAVEAGAVGDAVELVAGTIADAGRVNIDAARAALQALEERRAAASRVPQHYLGAESSGAAEPAVAHGLLARFEGLKQEHWPAMEALIRDVVHDASPEGSTLRSMCDYHMETGGKRLRAVLPILVAEALNCHHDSVLAFGAACEMLHNATLVHDDLQDGDMVRRGRMTVWNHFGVPQAINLGDAMFYFAVLLCQRTRATASAREALSRRLLRSTVSVIDGQELEFLLRGRDPLTDAHYVAMVEGKTSGLFALPMAGAAQLCGAPTAQVAALEEAARHMGVLFQIQDDVLDLYGDKGRGSRGADIAEGKRSVLVTHALIHAPAAKTVWLRQLLDKPRQETSAEEIAEATQLLRDVGSLRAALDEIDSRRERAAAIPELGPQLQALVVGMCDLFARPIAPLAERERAAQARPSNGAAQAQVRA